MSEDGCRLHGVEYGHCLFCIADSAQKERIATLERELAEAREHMRMFPVLGEGWSMPWWMLKPYEQQAMTNHDQSLEHLAGRGGLGSDEILLVIYGKPLREIEWATPNARARLEAWIADRDEPMRRARAAEADRDEWKRKAESLKIDVDALNRACIEEQERATKAEAAYAEVRASVEKRLADVRERLDKGKGEWPKPGYVQDEVWARMFGQHDALARTKVDLDSSDAGKGWVSPEEHGRLREELSALRSRISVLESAK